MRVRVGTSGYSYKEWKGVFYPEDVRPAGMLRFYADHLDTVEINNTFYRMPRESMLLGWTAQVPEGFRFALKAPRRITHQKRLRDAAEETSHLLRVSSAMGGKLGPLLFQLPPFLKKDAEALREFLGLLPGGCRAAFEFRNASWFDEEVRSLLRGHGAALVAADADGAEAPALDATAGLGYLRLRRERYDDAALSDWAARIAEQPWDEAYVFFKHEDKGEGPRLAERFRELVDRQAALGGAGRPGGGRR